ncbi:MAG: radical SAM family heme chaperone HemW [Gemmatimonadaceae bacterium]|nr:radical SAM family heme chaperone HemW [Gemmatimonadaceae bacterium]
MTASRHVYVHVPFCSRRCSYCDFAIAVRRTVPVDDYLHALGAELAIRYGDATSVPVESIYLGGGTPSRLGGPGVARAIELVRRHFPAMPGAEITIEANPEDVRADAVRAWVDAGVNRVSLGVQSFHPDVLQWMHRTHDAAGAERAVDVLRTNGIANLSLDLIFALPALLQRNLQYDIERILELDPQHVSLYGLTVEGGTPLGKWIAQGITIEQPEEGYESDFLGADQLLGGAGLEHYEVSNFGRPGYRARHNAAYWAGVSYEGLGPSAHGFDGDERRWNARHFTEWRQRLRNGIDPVDGSERLTAENRLAEFIYLGLRTSGGVLELAGEGALFDRWAEAGWVTREDDGRVRCTVTGWLRLDSLAAALTHHRSR